MTGERKCSEENETGWQGRARRGWGTIRQGLEESVLALGTTAREEPERDLPEGGWWRCCKFWGRSPDGSMNGLQMLAHPTQ